MEYILGLDFGSQSLCASVTSSADYNKAAIVRSNLSLDITPSAVSFHGGERFVGDSALAKKSIALQHTVDSFTHIMGLTPEEYSSPQCRERLLFFTNSISVGSEGRVAVDLPVGDLAKVPVEFLAAMLIDMVKEFAQLQVGGAVTRLSLSVPGVWTPRQCRSLLDASKIAGFTNTKLVRSTSAAAHLYGTRRFTKKGDETVAPQYVMLLDQGYSFLGVTIVQYSANSGKVCSSSFASIGGNDCDRAVWKYFAEKIEQDHKVKIKPASKIGLRLLQRIEKAKHILSTVAEAKLEVENALGDSDYKLHLTRPVFDSLCADLVSQLRDTIRNTLTKANLEAKDISVVEMVGGNTRAPYVQRAVEEMVGAGKLGFKLDSTSVMSEGAAILAALEVSGAKENVFVLDSETEIIVPEDVCGLSEEEIEAAVALEKRLKERDGTLKKIEEAKNALETYIYEIREKSYANSALLPPSTVSPLLEREEGWMYGDEAAGSVDESLYVSHLSALKGEISASCPDYFKSVEEARLKVEAQLDEEAKRAEAERALEPEDDHDFRKMKFPDRMRIMLKNKEEGTELFKDGNYLHATQRYIRALSHCQKFFDMSPEQKKEVSDVKLSLHLNLSMCYLKLASWDKVIDNCGYALEIDDKSAKALFRRATAHLNLQSYDDAMADLVAAQKVDGEDKAIPKLMEKVRAGQKNEIDKAKRMAKRMFG